MLYIITYLVMGVIMIAIQGAYTIYLWASHLDEMGDESFEVYSEVYEDHRGISPEESIDVVRHTSIFSWVSGIILWPIGFARQWHFISDIKKAYKTQTEEL